jgi:predicted RNA binding protein YcfA (HicA-like mRNA interferase family)
MSRASSAREMRDPACVKVRDMVKIIQLDGWRQVRTRGSHRHFVHAAKPGIVTVAGHDSLDLPPGTLRQIYRQAGLDWSRRPR